jgi:hypothetical protein
MPCCGNKRRQLQVALSGRMPERKPGTPSVAFTALSAVYFTYVGRSGLTILGPVSGRSYRFYRPGIAIAVDGRDAEYLNPVPYLRRAATL